MDNNKRIIGFDYLRVLAAFSVVMIHTCYMNITLEKFNIYNSYAVPVFILMSLYLATGKEKLNKRESILKLAKRIIPQYAFWTIVYLSLRYIKSLKTGEPITIDFSTIFLGGSAVQLWFLPAIFIWQIVILYVKSYKNFIIDILIASMLFVFGRFLMINNYLEVGFQNTFAIYTGYVFIAKLLKQYENQIERIPNYIFYALFIFSIGCKSFSSSYIWDVLYSITVFLVFLKLPFKSNSIISSISINSFGIYLIHFLFIQIIVFVYQMKEVEYSFLTTFICMLLAYLLSYLTSFVFSKNKYLKKLV